MDALILETSNLMDGVISNYEKEISKIRTGRANPNILENVKVRVYGDIQPLNSVASIKVTEARQLSIKVFDSSNVKTIVEAINHADLKVQVQVDATTIRLTFPTLTEELRKHLVRDLAKVTEEFRIKIRNHRRDALQRLKQQNLPEDNEKKQQEEIQKLTNQKIDLINNIDKTKIADLMHV